MVLSWLTGGRKTEMAAAKRLYARIMEQSRLPVFYAEGGVPDTLDGRFDMVALHLILVLRCLKAKEAQQFSQTVFDIFISDMDESFREIGVGDMTIGKRMKQMSHAFYGRVKAYEDGLKADDDEMLSQALHRNLYRGAGEIDPAALEAMTGYIRLTAAQLESESLEDLMAGRLTFKYGLELPET